MNIFREPLRFVEEIAVGELSKAENEFFKTALEIRSKLRKRAYLMDHYLSKAFSVISAKMTADMVEAGIRAYGELIHAIHQVEDDEEKELLAIRYGDCLAALRTNMSFQRKLGAVLAEKLVAVSENFTSAILCPAEHRLCSYIVKNAYREVFRDILTDVSASVGISYRHMLRLLAQFCEEGILARQSRGYLIADR